MVITQCWTLQREEAWDCHTAREGKVGRLVQPARVDENAAWAWTIASLRVLSEAIPFHTHIHKGAVPLRVSGRGSLRGPTGAVPAVFFDEAIP